MKDRAITVFAIYLRVGHNYYIELEEFDVSPLVLKAYETFQKQYGPIQFYGVNSNRVNLNSLLADQKIRKRLVLSTSDGKYVVPARIKRWNPIGDFFNNHLTVNLRPVRLTHKGKHIGDNVKYIIEFVPEQGQPEVVLVHQRDYELKMFKTFSFTYESLESAEHLKDHLQRTKEAGLLHCKSFDVHDVDEWRASEPDFYDDETIVASYYSFWRYHLLGRVGTWLSDRELKKSNETVRLEQQARAPAKDDAPQLSSGQLWTVTNGRNIKRKILSAMLVVT